MMYTDGGDDDKKDDKKKTTEEEEAGDPLIGDYNIDERAGEGHDPLEDNIT